MGPWNWEEVYFWWTDYTWACLSRDAEEQQRSVPAVPPATQKNADSGLVQFTSCSRRLSQHDYYDRRAICQYYSVYTFIIERNQFQAARPPPRLSPRIQSTLSFGSELRVVRKAQATKSVLWLCKGVFLFYLFLYIFLVQYSLRQNNVTSDSEEHVTFNYLRICKPARVWLVVWLEVNVFIMFIGDVKEKL